MAPRANANGAPNPVDELANALNNLYPGAPAPAAGPQYTYANPYSFSGAAGAPPVSTYTGLFEPFEASRPKPRKVQFPEPAASVRTNSEYHTAYSQSARSIGGRTDSTGFSSQPGATWPGALGKTANSGFASGRPGYKGVREGREKDAGLPKRKGVGRTGKEPAKVPREMLRVMGRVDKYEGDFIRLKYGEREHRLKFLEKTLDEDVDVGDLREAAAEALKRDSRTVRLWYKDVELKDDDALCADYGLVDNSRVVCTIGGNLQTKARREKSPHVKFSDSNRDNEAQFSRAEDAYASDIDSETYLDCLEDPYAYPSRPTAPEAEWFSSSRDPDEDRRRQLENARARIDLELNFLGGSSRRPGRSSTADSTLKAAKIYPPRDELELRHSALEARRSKLESLRRLAFDPKPGVDGEETVRLLRLKVADLQSTGSNFASERSRREVESLRRKLGELQELYERERVWAPESEFRAEMWRRDRVVDDLKTMIVDMVERDG